MDLEKNYKYWMGQETVERIYPEFPEREYEERCEKAKKTMEEQAIDALFITEKENIEYYTGFMSGHWGVKDFAPAMAIIPRETDPVMIIPDFFFDAARRTAWIKNLRLQPHPHVKPREFPNSVVKTIREMGLANSVIGCEAGENLHIDIPLVDFDNIRANLPESKFVNGADVIWKCRLVKSALEIERLRKAASITGKAFDVARDTVKEGMTEIEIANVFKHVFVDEGADGYNPNGLGFFNIHGGPDKYSGSDTVVKDRKIRKGNRVIVNVGSVHRGYWSNMARFAFVGTPPTERERSAYDVLYEAMQVNLEYLKPGIKESEVQTHVHDCIESAGFLDLLPFSGIGLGLDVHEPPMLAPGLGRTIEVGMVITMMAWFSQDPESRIRPVFGIEHGFVVTEAGNKPLIPFKKEEIWII